MVFLTNRINGINLSDSLFKKMTIGVFLFFGIIMYLIPFLNHYFFRTYAFDYGAYNFAFYDYSHLKVSPNPVYWYDDTSFLQDHLSFTLFFFIPIFWSLKWILGTYTLLFIQSSFIIWGAWSTTKLVTDKTDSIKLGFLALVIYFTIYGRYSAFAGDCNLMIILSAFVPVFLYYFHKGKIILSILCFLFLILGRESVPLWTFFISLYLMLEYRKDRTKLILAGSLAIVSVLYFIVAFKLLIPYFENPNRPFDLFQYKELGATPGEALVYMLGNPIECFKLLFYNNSSLIAFDGLKIEFYIVYLVSGGFLLFTRPKYIIPFIPIVAQKMFNDDPIRWSIASYYGVEFASLVPLLAMSSLVNYKNIKLRYFLGVTAVICTAWMCLYRLNPSNTILDWSEGGKTDFLKYEFYHSDFPIQKMHELINQIPQDAKVSATGTIVPHLAFREHVQYFPRMDNDVDYIVLLDDGKQFGITQKEFEKKVQDLRKNKSLKILFDDGMFIIFVKKNYSNL